MTTCRKCGAKRVDQQIGLEQTPQEYVSKLVAIFREVRRVLKDDGTVWLNLGDSYAGSGKGPSGNFKDNGERHLESKHSAIVPDGLKPKDLVGIPWRVAKALQQPYYTGKIKDEKDRVWLAAMVDGEGCICGTEYSFKEKIKTNLYISITNSNKNIINNCERIFPQKIKHVYLKTKKINLDVYRWDVEQLNIKQQFITEIYPYLVAKKKQAIIGWNFLEMQRGLHSKKKGYLTEQQEKRSWMIKTLSKLNHGGNIDLPDWLEEPPSLYEPGFYLRQDIIWHKPNPMPESVTDRCTKAHEYIFLLSKNKKYYYDAKAVKEKSVDPESINGRRKRNPREADKSGDKLLVQNIYKVSDPIPFKNKRSVWTIATQPFPESHFATFPQKLIEPCILAGSKKGDIILDPFSGAGTTPVMAEKHKRQWIGLELNEDYCEIQKKRIRKETRQLTII